MIILIPVMCNNKHRARYMANSVASLVCIILLVFSVFNVLPFGVGAAVGGVFCVSLGVYAAIVLFDATSALQIAVITPVTAVLCYAIFWFAYTNLWIILHGR